MAPCLKIGNSPFKFLFSWNYLIKANSLSSNKRYMVVIWDIIIIIEDNTGYLWHSTLSITWNWSVIFSCCFKVSVNSIFDVKSPIMNVWKCSRKNRHIVNICNLPEIVKETNNTSFNSKLLSSLRNSLQNFWNRYAVKSCNPCLLTFSYQRFIWLQMNVINEV